MKSFSKTSIKKKTVYNRENKFIYNYIFVYLYDIVRDRLD